MATNTQTKGLLYLLVSPGNSVSTEQLYAWYDSVRNTPSIHALNANIYEAADGQNPLWLAVYEFQNVDGAEDWIPQLQSSVATARFETVEIRIYTLFSEKISPTYATTAGPDRVFRTIALQPGPDLLVKDYNDWYEQEHVPLLSVAPGWLKSTRWTLTHPAKRWSHGEQQVKQNISHYFAIHEWESDQSFSTPEFKHATSTAWRDQIIPRLDKELGERRNFKPHKRIL